MLFAKERRKQSPPRALSSSPTGGAGAGVRALSSGGALGEQEEDTHVGHSSALP